MIVPLRRNLKAGSKGKDALALKRALSRKGYLRWRRPFSPLIGATAARAIRRFQAQHSDPRTHKKLVVDGVYGPASHRAMVAANGFDAYGKKLMGSVPKTGGGTTRAKIVAAAVYGYNNRAQIHYTQSRWRMYGVRNRIRPPKIPLYEDCSSWVTWCYWLAGAPDPNGLAYNGYGFTGTLIAHGHRLTDSSQLKPGDLVFYGRNIIPSHVSVYVGGGRAVSHGSEVGPLLVRWNYRYDIHSLRSYL